MTGGRKREIIVNRERGKILKMEENRYWGLGKRKTGIKGKVWLEKNTVEDMRQIL